MPRFPLPYQVGLVAGLALACGLAQADDASAPAFKLTLGLHSFSQSGHGTDLNLRHTSGLGNVWLGYFHADGLGASQWRGGWDGSWGSGVRIMPSLQVASGGFVGGSVNVETGDSWFVGAGLGHTNLRPYFNLNFDPNDAWTLSGGYRAADGASYALSVVRDNRLNPDQQHLHAVWRTPLPGGDRLTLDLLDKRGLVGGLPIRRLGVTATYDWPRHFVRLAYDPNTNFTPDNAVRLSVGTRF
jgi:hypothetical protein